MATTPGVDYAWDHPGGAALKAAGRRFACRYLSHDASKNLSRAEATDLAAHGVSSVVVWEATANRALGGRGAGIQDAHDAVQQATAAGMPAQRPVYFAVDFDAQPAQIAAVMAYLDGAASVLGVARVGVYGGYRAVKAALDGGHARWAWQTRAWSAGQWDPRAQIRQLAYVTVNHVQCDDNQAYATDFGQWTPGAPQPQEEDMPLTKTDVELLLDTEMDDPTKTGTAKVTVRGALWAAYGQAAAANSAVQKTTAQVGALQGVVTQLLTAVKTGGGLTAEQATAAAEAGAKAALDQLGNALTS